jgi:hypothetical protein
VLRSSVTVANYANPIAEGPQELFDRLCLQIEFARFYLPQDAQRDGAKGRILGLGTLGGKTHVFDEFADLRAGSGHERSDAFSEFFDFGLGQISMYALQGSRCFWRHGAL